MFAQFESDGPSGLLLSDGCAIRRIATSSDIFDPDGDDVTAAKLAVDSQIKQGEVASAAFGLELSSGSTRHAWVAVAALPRSACPCSRATVYEASGQHSLDLTWSFSSVTVTEEESMCHWRSIHDPTNQLLLRAQVVYLEPAEKLAHKTILKGRWPWFVATMPR
jgi:hypothetical protein